MNDRRMHLYLYMRRGHKKRQGLRGWLPVLEEFSAPGTGKHNKLYIVKMILIGTIRNITSKVVINDT